MKAREVIKRYVAGERNFQHVNVQGQSFEGEDLSGADFSGANIQSTNFASAVLARANFSGVQCGLQLRWATLIVILPWLLSAISGLGSVMAAAFISPIFGSSDVKNQIAGWLSLIALFVFLILILFLGIKVATVVVTSIVALFGAVAVAMFGPVDGAGIIVEIAAGALAGTVPGVGAVAIAIAIASPGLVTIPIAVAVSVAILVVVLVISIIVPVPGVVSGVFPEAFALALAGILALFGIYIGKRALKGDKRDAWIRLFCIVFGTLGGTKFYGADLTEANFSRAKLKGTDMRKATLSRVRWYGAKELELVRSGDTYLKDAQIRRWLVGKGSNKNFDRKDLRGTNFQGASLADASFISADLSEANFQDTDLTKVKFVQTQLDRTDFTGAILTGACIEDWGITTHTKLDNIQCAYVYMRLQTKDNPNPYRKPDNWEDNFKDNDFADFIKPIIDTLDLYHNQEVDPRAIAISWNELSENNPDAELEIVATERKSTYSFLLRAKTSSLADKSQLNAEYFETYNQIRALTEADYKKLIAEKDDRIANLENMVNTALKHSGFYTENYNHQGDNKMAGERNIGGNYYEQSGNLGIGHMSDGKIQEGARVAGVINEAEKQNIGDTAKEIQQLLEQLSEAYPTTTSKEKMTVVGEAVDRIEYNSFLKAKVVNALKAGGTEAFKEAVDHPLVNILMATIEGWQDTEQN